MKVEVSGNVLNETTKCRKNFSCLTEEHGNICKVLCCMKGDIYFVKCLGEKDCPYLEASEKTERCTCPVRKEIYQRYKI